MWWWVIILGLLFGGLAVVINRAIVRKQPLNTRSVFLKVLLAIAIIGVIYHTVRLFIAMNNGSSIDAYLSFVISLLFLIIGLSHALCRLKKEKEHN